MIPCRIALQFAVIKFQYPDADGVSPENIYKRFAWINDMACSSMAGVMQYAGVHGGGSPMMEEIAVVGTYDIQEKKELAKHVAAIEG